MDLTARLDEALRALCIEVEFGDSRVVDAAAVVK